MGAKLGQLVGAKNGNWRGGRVVEPRGYVLIRVGVGHPLADVRGYAYEHRLKTSNRLGRFVSPVEVVHHDDENTGNNSDSNLVLTKSNAHHIHEHHGNPRNRHPDEANFDVTCRCGCGALLKRYDGEGRPRHYVSGHNLHPSPTIDAVLAILSEGQAHRSVIAQRCAISDRAASTCLSKLKRTARATSNGYGTWRLV